MLPDLLFRPVVGFKPFPVLVSNRQKPGKIFRRFGTAADREEVSYLYQQARFPLAGASHHISQFRQSRDKPVITDTQ